MCICDLSVLYIIHIEQQRNRIEFQNLKQKSHTQISIERNQIHLKMLTCLINNKMVDTGFIVISANYLSLFSRKINGFARPYFKRVSYFRNNVEK